MTATAYAMPSGPIDNPGLWLGADVRTADDWIFRFSSAHLEELDRALRAVVARGLKPPAFGKEDFPVPGLASVFKRWIAELERGRGFLLVRGIPMDRYTDDEAAILFWGIGRHLGLPLTQNTDGHVLGHVRNVGASISDTNVRGYQTSVELTFHNDPCDVIGLMCLRTAVSGGESSLVSVPAIYNQMARERPDLLEELFSPYYFDRRGELGREDEGDDPFYAMPVFSYHKGLLTAHYVRGYMMSAQRFPEVPRLTPRRIEALDLFDEIATRPGVPLRFNLMPGDIELVNNYCVLHAREAFVDHEKLEDRRHLLRIWLVVPESRELPPAFRKRFGSCVPGTIRGGFPPGRLASPDTVGKFQLERT